MYERSEPKNSCKLRGAQNPYIRVPQRAVSRGVLCLGAESRLRLFLRLASVLINLSGSRVLGFAVLSGYENNNLRAGKERQPLCRQFNLQKNKMIDMIIALQYNEAVKSGIGNI
jgi:hypothetical protein